MKYYCINDTFTHCLGSCDKIRPSSDWVFNAIPPEGSGDPVLYTDGLMAVSDRVARRKDFGWMCESPALLGSLKSWIKDNLSYVEDRFIKVFTPDRELLQISDVFEYSYGGSNAPWIKDLRIREDKDRLVSIIASNKKVTEGHRLRHDIVKNNGEMDVFGNGYRRIEKKEEGLEKYMFTYCIENVNCDLYFTEKLSDCIACGTVPIFWGPRTISEIFDTNGIIFYEDMDAVELSADLYHSMMPGMRHNLEVLKKMPTADDMVQSKMKEILNG